MKNKKNQSNQYPYTRTSMPQMQVHAMHQREALGRFLPLVSFFRYPENLGPRMNAISLLISVIHIPYKEPRNSSLPSFPPSFPPLFLPSSRLGLQSISTLGRRLLPLHGPHGLEALLMLGQSSSDGTRLLPAQIQRHVLRAGKFLTQLGLLGLVVDGQDAGDGLADDLCDGQG